jgi:hypothetical protein
MPKKKSKTQPKSNSKPARKSKTGRAALVPENIAALADLGLDDRPAGTHGAHPHETGHGDGTIRGVREREYRGRHIRIETTYRITVNGEPFAGHASLNDQGRLYSHACPYRDFASAVDLMAYLVDQYPQAFEQRGVAQQAPSLYSGVESSGAQEVER